MPDSKRFKVQHVQKKRMLWFLQVQTYRFQGHSPADPEHERGRKDEKTWARATQDPIAIFQSAALDAGTFTQVRDGDAGGITRCNHVGDVRLTDLKFELCT